MRLFDLLLGRKKVLHNGKVVGWAIVKDMRVYDYELFGTYPSLKGITMTPIPNKKGKVTHVEVMFISEVKKDIHRN